jgi:hypothetical protein
MLLVVMFSYAAVSKLWNYERSLGEMRNQVFPIILADTLTWLIPLIEISIVICLVYIPFQRIGLRASLVVLSIFSIYILLAATKIFGRTPCSCAGILWQNSTYWHQLGFNLLFITMAVIALSSNYLKDRGKGIAQSPATIRKEGSIKIV